MKFGDLLTLPAEESTNRVDRAAVFSCLPDTPTEVAEQFFVDHGRNEEFQRQYASLAIDRLRWRKVHERASVLIAASICPNFKNWFDSVALRAAAFEVHGWHCVDTRPAVQLHWQEYGTWRVPPIVLVGGLLSSTAAYHLAEGHTRVGLLSGLVAHGVLAGDSVHCVWCADSAT